MTLSEPLPTGPATASGSAPWPDDVITDGHSDDMKAFQAFAKAAYDGAVAPLSP